MTLGFTFGKGYKRLHNDRSGVDLCIGAAGQNIHNIAPVHESIILHPRSGAIMLQGSSPQNPLFVIEGTERIQLFADQSYVVSSKQTRIQIGDLKFILRTCSYEGKSMMASPHSGMTCSPLLVSKSPTPIWKAYRGRNPG